MKYVNERIHLMLRKPFTGCLWWDKCTKTWHCSSCRHKQALTEISPWWECDCKYASHLQASGGARTWSERICHW